MLYSRNNFTSSQIAIGLSYHASNNRIFHNNFINAYKVNFVEGERTNIWDNGYPSGGNYWSDYNGIDLYNGPYQNLSGSDGIGDTPYIVGGSLQNIDRYPLMFPWGLQNTMPPHIRILSPTNTTHLESNVPLRFTLTESTSWIGYSLDGEFNITIYGNTTLFNLAEGKHTVTVYAADMNGNAGRSNTISFTVHALPPNIQLLSPENKTYSTSSVILNFTVDEPTQWIGYNLDGEPNVTLYGSPSILLSGLTDGTHTVFVYATDVVGHTGTNGTYFSIDTRAGVPPDSPTLGWPIIAAAIIIFSTVGALIGYSIGKRGSSRRVIGH